MRWLIPWVVLLAGCTSNVPQPIREAPPGNPRLAEVRAEPETFIGQRVRWGGTIAEVINRPQESWVQVVGRELGDEGRPRGGDRSEGRFIAVFGDFIDPAVFAEGRRLTVTGTITGGETLDIGEYPYRFPLVRVESHQLWAQETATPRYYYDPWYDPFWPSAWPYGWPYYRPYY